MTNKTGILELIEGTNLTISGKHYYALPTVQPYLKNFHQGDTVEFSTSKNDKGAVSFLKAGHVTGSQVPKEEPKPKEHFQEDITQTAGPTRWDEIEAKVRAMHPEDRVQWAVKVLEDLHGVPDRIETLARLIIKTKEEGDQIAAQVGEQEKKPTQTAAMPSPSPPPAGKVELPVAPAKPGPAPASANQVKDLRDPREMRIVRQSCLKAAVQLVCGRDIPLHGDEDPEGKPQSITQIAEHFEAWVWRS